MLVSAAGCAEQKKTVEDPTVVAVIEDQAVPLYDKPAGSLVRVPSAPGTVSYSTGNVTLDASNANQGYVMIKYGGSNPKIKVQITKPGTDTYTYDLNARSNYEVFPLTEGSGAYQIKVFENASGNQYAQVFSQDIQIALVNELEPFLYPNQYVFFTPGSAAVQKGAELTASASAQIDVVTSIYNYVVDTIHYDTAKAQSVQSGYLPNVDQVLAQKTGICFDYAAVMTAMLRSQNIPTKLVVGYTGNLYHAWINVYLDNQGWVDNIIFFDGHDWQLMDPTFASSGGRSEEINQYISNRANYKSKYTY